MKEPHYPRDVNACQDMESFTALYELYSARIFTYFQYRCADSPTARDLTIQVFERLLRCLPGYDAQRAPFSAWLFSIARHVIADWQRQQYLHKLIPWDDFSRRPSADPGPEQVVLESEERRSLRAALARLSSRERDLVGLRFSSGLTNRAIAELSGLSESNVAVILYRALRKLRGYLADTAKPCDFLAAPAAEEINCQAPAPIAEVEHE